MKNKFTNKKFGFSLVEGIFVIVVMTLVGIAVWTFQKDVFFLNSIIDAGFNAENDARSLVKQFSSEARIASQGAEGSYPIAKATATEFIFFSDLDGDGINERVRYFLNGTVLKKGVIKATGNPLLYATQSEIVKTSVIDVANGSTAVFEYFGSNYNGETAAFSLPVNIQNIRLVKITVIIDRSTVRSPAPMRITTQVSLRNLKDNL